MTRSIFLTPIIVLAICIGAGVSAGAARSQDTKGNAAPEAAPKRPVVAVLDLVAIRRLSLAGKSISSQFDARRKQLQKQAASEEKKFNTAREELARQRGLLSPEAVRSREQQFRQEFGATQRKFQLQKRDLERAMAAAEKVLQGALQDVLKTVVAEQGIDLILRRQGVVYTGPGIDITSETIQRLNKRLPSVAVAEPKTKKK